MNENAITKVAEQVKAIENLERADLAKRDTVRGIVRTAHAIRQEAKEVEKQDKALKEKVKELCANEVAQLSDGQHVTFYDVENGQKVYINVVGRGQVNIDGDVLLGALYDHFGERRGSKRNSKAYAIWQQVAKPKWEIDQEALFKFVLEDASLGTAVGLAATPKKEVVKFNAVNMTATEKKAAKAGELHDGMIVG